MVNRIAESVVDYNTISKTTSVENSVESITPITSHTKSENLSTGNDEQEHLPAEKAKKMTDSMNKFLETTNTELRFKYHEELNTYYVTLIDSKTDEIVREIPSKKMLDMYAAMQDFMGLFVDKKI
ncbi:flagellar protein FlaG [Psychrobacillus sp. OK032]|uniref:flagellar protein FlaG n=1 Tax=Psychrobacillus sp. OK032 TaxID=1884358 RepID=UPI0008C35FAF|nr:flagellar protein FlaG [Psychrobacillus sp. OK032]SER65222.1 flagellar protein FlaG [Psychrobacillus sp. OK032]